MKQHLSIHGMFEKHAETFPHDIAVMEGDLAYTYELLNQRANQFAHYLQGLGLKPNSIVALALERSWPLLVSLLGILKSNLAYLPLEAALPQERLQYLLQDAKVSFLITDSRSKAQYQDTKVKLILIDEIELNLNHLAKNNLDLAYYPEQLAYVIYTSGSTGWPKGVLIEHRSVVNYTHWLAHYTGVKAQDRIDFSSSIMFDMAVTSSLSALALGLQIAICPDKIKKDPRQYFNYLHQHKINIIKLTPSYFKILIQDFKLQFIELANLNILILGGEILYTKDCRHWLERYPQHILFNEYGPTEATVGTTEFKINRDNIANLNDIVPIGKPGLHMACRLLDNELYIGGEGLAKAYLNQTELTLKKFILDAKSGKRYYKTGDCCRYLDDGNLEFIKRIDDQIKIRGFRVELQEIEIQLAAHPLIKDLSVMVHEDATGEKQIIAYYIPKNENDIPTHQEWLSYASARLPDYMLPSFFVKMNSFPLTENGKLDKKHFPLPSLCPEIKRETHNEFERQLIHIWQKIFSMPNIGRNSHFFKLGGHSLTAARMMIEIEAIFGKRIALQALYQAPTIQELASIIAHAETNDSSIALEQFANTKTDIVPLADFQFIFWISSFFEAKTKKLNIVSRRRLAGKLDIQVLHEAFMAVIQKHAILSYQIGQFSPIQYPKKQIQFQIIENDLSKAANEEMESQLLHSMKALYQNVLWPKNKPLILVKLFYLENEKSELQICVPHIIFDDVSLDILFDDLSMAYREFQEKKSIRTEHVPQFKDYVFYEQHHSNQDLDQYIQFWRDYLTDADLTQLPETEVIQNMKNVPFSTYLPLPDDFITKIQVLCASASISVADLMASTVGLSMKKLAGSINKKIMMNVVRSLREHEVHHEMMGCFLRLDSIKVDLTSNEPLLTFAKTIQTSRLANEAHQSCSGLLKQACLNPHLKQSTLLHRLLYFIFTCYCSLFPKLKLNPQSLLMYFRINEMRTPQRFIININLFNHFIDPTQTNTLFNLKLEQTPTFQCDLSHFNNVFDVSFLKNESLNKSYLVISANVKPSYREKIGNEIIQRIMSSC